MRSGSAFGLGFGAYEVWGLLWAGPALYGLWTVYGEQFWYVFVIALIGGPLLSFTVSRWAVRRILALAIPVVSVMLGRCGMRGWTH